MTNDDDIDPKPGISLRKLRSLCCRECGVPQGELHEQGCWQEHCSQCGGQAVFCGHNESDPIVQLPRIPFICWTNVCAGCGQLSPQFLALGSPTWLRRHPEDPRADVDELCEDCEAKL